MESATFVTVLLGPIDFNLINLEVASDFLHGIDAELASTPGKNGPPAPPPDQS